VQVYALKSSVGSSSTDALFVVVGVPSIPYGSPSLYSLFTDSRMSKTDADSMRDFFEDNYGIPAGTGKVVELRATLRPHSQEVEIPGVLTYQAHLLSNHVDENVRHYLYPWLGEPEQWITRVVRYKQAGDRTIQYRHTNSLLATFDLGEPDLPGRSSPGACSR